MPWELTSKLDNVPHFLPEPGWDRMLTSASVGMGPKFDIGEFPTGYPKGAKLDNKVKLGDIQLDTITGTAVVSSTVQEIIENMEPDVHQFLPIEVFDKSGKMLEGEYFNLRYGQSISAILSKQSGFDGNWRKDWQGNPISGLPAHAEKLVFSEYEIRGKHLWLNPSFHGPVRIFISDQLMMKISPLAIQHLYCRHHEAISLPWNVEDEIGKLLDSIKENWETRGTFSKEIYNKYRKGV